MRNSVSSKWLEVIEVHQVLNKRTTLTCYVIVIGKQKFSECGLIKIQGEGSIHVEDVNFGNGYESCNFWIGLMLINHMGGNM